MRRVLGEVLSEGVKGSSGVQASLFSRLCIGKLAYNKIRVPVPLVLRARVERHRKTFSLHITNQPPGTLARIIIPGCC